MRLIDADVLKEQDFQDFSDTDVFSAIDRCPTVDGSLLEDYYEEGRSLGFREGYAFAMKKVKEGDEDEREDEIHHRGVQPEESR